MTSPQRNAEGIQDREFLFSVSFFPVILVHDPMMNSNTEPALLDRAIRFAPLIFLVLAIVSGGICLKFFGPFTGDSSRYLLLGHNLARGHGFSAAAAPPFHPETFRPPLYPAFLATMMRLGLGVYGIIAVQLLSYYLAVILMVRTASTITGNRLSALLLGLILTGYPPLVHWGVSITSEFLCSVLYCILCWSAYSFFRRPSWANTSVLSLTSAALFLTRPEYIVLFPLLVGISLYRFHRNSTWYYTGALAILMVLPIGGWMLRNVAVIPGPPRPLGLGAGMTLWIRTIELQEPDVGRRTAWLAHPDFQTLHSRDDPSALRVADDNLRREAVEVIRAMAIFPGRVTHQALRARVGRGLRSWSSHRPSMVHGRYLVLAVSAQFSGHGLDAGAVVRILAFGTNCFWGGSDPRFRRYGSPIHRSAEDLLIHVFLLLACITSAVVLRSPGGPAGGTSGSGAITRRSRQFSVIRRPDPRLGSRRSHARVDIENISEPEETHQ